jgi:hypothetical protein
MATGVGVLKLETVVPRRLEWGWRDRLVAGAVNLIEGDPDDGKSLITLDLAARFSTGRAMPDGTPNGFGRPATVLLLCSEDDEETTVTPRLLAAGADLARVRLLQTVTVVTTDKEGHAHQHQQIPFWPDDAGLVHAEAEAEALGAEVLIVDPLMAFLSAKVNPNSDQEVRAALRPTQVWAKRARVLVLLVRHLNKNSRETNPKYRGANSIGILGLARSCLLVGIDPEQPEGDDERRVLVPQKHNLAKRSPGLAYRVVTLYDPGLDDHVPYIDWLGPSHHTARTLLRLPREDDPDERSMVERAVATYRDLLAPGPRKSEMIDALVAKQFTRSTMHRARAKCPVYVARVGGAGTRGYWLSSLTPLDGMIERQQAVEFDQQAEAEEAEAE